MIDPEVWASAVIAAEQFENHLAIADDDARAVLERQTRQVVLCGGPVEVFSDKMPVYAPEAGDEDLAPIDVLYGRYIPAELKIEIFVNRIKADAPRFQAEFRDLLTIVRLHEHAHAIVHAGIGPLGVFDRLAAFGPSGTTDWETFRNQRDARFAEIGDDGNELLAQAITWSCITQEAASDRIDRLIATFNELERHQPKRYRLPAEVKARARRAKWAVVLWAVQGKAPKFQRGPDFDIAAGLTELIKRTAGSEDTTELRPDDEIALAVADLQDRLATVDLISAEPGPDPDRIELLVKRKSHIELRMYKEAGHKRPHFHLEYKHEFNAAYALDDFTLLAGSMPRKYEDEILAFARGSQSALMDRWESLNGTVKCSVQGD